MKIKYCRHIYNSVLNPKNYTFITRNDRKFIFPILLLIIEINHSIIKIWNDCYTLRKLLLHVYNEQYYREQNVNFAFLSPIYSTHDTLFPLYESLSKFIFKFRPLKLKTVRKSFFSNTMTKHDHRQRAFQFACTSDAQSLFLKMRNYAQSIVVASRLIKQQLLFPSTIYRSSLFWECFQSMLWKSLRISNVLKVIKILEERKKQIKSHNF